jgi:hypothetical protein
VGHVSGVLKFAYICTSAVQASFPKYSYEFENVCSMSLLDMCFFRIYLSTLYVPNVGNPALSSLFELIAGLKHFVSFFSQT